MEANRKEATVVMLPTDKTNGVLWETTSGQLIHTHVSGKFKTEYKPFNLYITTEEDFMSGEWVLFADVVMIAKAFDDRVVYDGEGNSFMKYDCKKIIATTDRSLRTKKISDDVICRKCSHLQAGSAQPSCPQCDYPTPHLEIETIYLPQPSQAFIEKYCEVGGIDKVMVEYDEIHITGQPFPRSKFRLKVDSHNEITIHSVKDS